MIIKSLKALGIYGGASLNSVELALIVSDGVDIQRILNYTAMPYPEELASGIRMLIARRNWSFDKLENSPEVQNLRRKISDFYIEAVEDFCDIKEVNCIGIDGITLVNDPQNRCSYQLEDGHYTANKFDIPVVTHFHKADLLTGGQASPLSPSFLRSLLQNAEKPLLVIDIETVTSLVYISESGEIKAFDCAPGTAMIDDWCFRHANMQTDYNGRLAITGRIDQQIVTTMLQHKLLRKQPPKSLDIMAFSDKKEHLEGLSLEDGAATATAFIAEAVYQAAFDFLPAIPRNIYICGEGAKNPSLTRFIKQHFAPRNPQMLSEIRPELSAVGAQSTAFNAIRRMYGLPITYPHTTGTSEPITGGEIYEKK